DRHSHAVIDLPQEQEKFGSGSGYLADVMAATQARFSHRKQEILRLFAEADAANPSIRPDEPAAPGKTKISAQLAGVEWVSGVCS
ncbi:MAG: hypothetical protein J2P17_06780, partial [Mycobacterium sp.]|nr:hypothetical protein [Mycobacterium sp.]